MRDAASVRVTTTKAALDALAAERERYREALERIKNETEDNLAWGIANAVLEDGSSK